MSPAVGKMATVPSKYSTPGSVPPFNEFYAPIHQAGRAQQRYFLWMLEEFAEGRTPDIEENISYLFAFVYRVVEAFLQGPDYPLLAARFQLVRDGYADTK